MSDLEEALEASLADKGIHMFPTKEAVGPGEDNTDGRKEYIASVDRERAGRSEVSTLDPWEVWADAAQASIDKLLNENRTYKFAIAGLAGVCGLALVVSGLSLKVVSKIAAGMQMLSANQEAIVAAMQGNTEPGQPVAQDIPQPYDPQHDPTVDETAKVAKPYDGPASSTTAEQARLMRQDGQLGEALKGEMPGVE